MWAFWNLVRAQLISKDFPRIPIGCFPIVLLKLGGFLVQTRFDIVWDEAAECAIYHPLGLKMIADITAE